jgi:hypothetical protein
MSQSTNSPVALGAQQLSQRIDLTLQPSLALHHAKDERE